MAKPNRVREVRDKEAISKADLARKADLSERTIKRVEDGKCDCAPLTKHKIVRAFNNLVNKQLDYTIEYLFPDTNSHSP